MVAGTADARVAGKTGVLVRSILVCATVRIGVGDDAVGVVAGNVVGGSVGEGRGVLVGMGAGNRVADGVTCGVGVVFGVMITMWDDGEQAVNRKTAIAVMMIVFRMCLFAQ